METLTVKDNKMAYEAPSLDLISIAPWRCIAASGAETEGVGLSDNSYGSDDFE